MDFGMENCSITLTTPPNPDTAPPRPDQSTHQPSSQGPEGSDTEILLDVWSLNSTYSIKQFQLSWLTKPSRQAHLGVLPFRWNTTVSLPGFPCKHGTYQNIELSCQSGECDVDVESTAREAIGELCLLFLFPMIENGVADCVGFQFIFRRIYQAVSNCVNLLSLFIILFG